MAAPHLNLHGIPERREANHFNCRTNGEAHFHDAAFRGASQIEDNDCPTLARPERAQGLRILLRFAHRLDAKTFDFDVLPELATQGHPCTHQLADNCRTICDLPKYRTVVESHLSQSDAMGTIRANVAHAKSFAAFSCCECELWRSGKHRRLMHIRGNEIASQ